MAAVGMEDANLKLQDSHLENPWSEHMFKLAGENSSMTMTEELGLAVHGI